MQEEKPMSLKEQIMAEKKRRAAAIAAEEAAFKVDEESIEKDDEILQFLEVQINETDHPVHHWLCNLAERMGMELKTIGEDGTHVYKRETLRLYIKPDFDVCSLEEKYPNTGNIFSHMVEPLEEKRKPYIEEKMTNILFRREDEEIKKMIDADKIAWNTHHSKKHGKWA